MPSKVCRCFAVLAAVLLWGCRTPIRPPVEPVANLFPTLHAASVLSTTIPAAVSEPALRGLLTRSGVLAALERCGLDPLQLELAVRGLGARGYAEIDARRSACPVHWVVIRAHGKPGGSEIVVEAGMKSIPDIAVQAGIDPTSPAAESVVRMDANGRPERIDTWRGMDRDVRITIRQARADRLAASRWELECRFPWHHGPGEV